MRRSGSRPELGHVFGESLAKKYPKLARASSSQVELTAGLRTGGPGYATDENSHLDHPHRSSDRVRDASGRAGARMGLARRMGWMAWRRLGRPLAWRRMGWPRLGM